MSGQGAVKPRNEQEIPIVFFWENLGPNHVDRLEAVTRTGRRVIGLEVAGSSNVYGWKREEDSGIEVHTLFADHADTTRPKLAGRLIRALARIGPANIFLSHYDQPTVFAAALAMRLLGRRVFTMLDSKFDDYPRRIGREVLKSVLLRPYNGALTASLRSRDYLAFLGVAPERIALGYDAVAVDRIAALAGTPPAPGGTPFAERDFVVVARLVPKKNVALAIRAFACWLGQTGHPRDLHLCGSGPLEEELRRLAAELGVANHVHFHGFVQTEAVSRHISRALCLILPSVEEQFGLVVIEAQAMGLPVLVGRNAGAADMLIDPGLNGFTLDPNNPQACAALMLLLSEDEDRWRRFVEAAYAGRYRGDVRTFVAGVEALLADGNVARTDVVA